LSVGPLEKLYTVRQVAELLSMHRESVYREVREGNLRAERLSPRRMRIPASELERYVAERMAHHRSSASAS
jgi:excisionase family DNA binding protein